MSKHGKTKHRMPRVRRLFSRAWVSWQESSAIMYGVPIEVNADSEPPNHRSPSPLVTEVHTHTEAHASGRVF